MFFDTHAHLFDERFASDLSEVLERAATAQVSRVLCLGIDRGTSVASVEIADRYSQVLAAVGIQPNHVAEAQPTDWDEITRLAASNPRVVAIGETGLDRYWDRSPFELQIEYFSRHIELARHLSKPFIIHCRDAEHDVVGMLREEFDKHGPIRAVMHSFSGDIETAQQCLAMGLMISFAGMLTYKTAQQLRDVAKLIPLNRLMIETDSPYLPPVPHRGKRNEPAFVVHTATCLAELHDITPDQLAFHTTRNAQYLLGTI